VSLPEWSRLGVYIRRQTEKMQIETVIAALSATKQNLEALKRMPDIQPDTLEFFSAFVNNLEDTLTETLADVPPKNERELDVAIARTAENLHQTQGFRRAIDELQLRGSPDELFWINTTRTCVEALRWHLQFLIEAKVRLVGTALEGSKFGGN
jgi:hypothetical protein